MSLFVYDFKINNKILWKRVFLSKFKVLILHSIIGLFFFFLFYVMLFNLFNIFYPIHLYIIVRCPYWFLFLLYYTLTVLLLYKYKFRMLNKSQKYILKDWFNLIINYSKIQIKFNKNRTYN